ncbi:MAG: ABC transporter permease subunit [Rhodospirillaceae bacterium]|jgi:ABC-type nitrate/sulfonate/bicarbonate transport system permease component|nr:ABC transporter permease subunit [Rhodospirillaceae bacterium]MBT3884032.1 ABC transporter permease subunit [Rhodospirillaceae bacterium]MBT4118616.1 ABC transporter permease subunit [Rhodospirillaceae bacterium]MBT4674639.1 ABC transporter permease subunit [Rhodospirillaceae bacterium]MBT4751200.1 ABC transporter permease subunit [Rhodospirillaceae bacterium]
MTDAITVNGAKTGGAEISLANILWGTPVRAKLFAGLMILAVWQVGVALFAANFVAKPLNIIQVFPKVLADPAFQDAAISTLTAVFQGLAIALVAGTIVGVAMGRLKVFDRALNFYVNGFYTLPMIALLPLITIWFGYGADARLATIIFAGFFSIVINARDGARSVPPEYLEVCKAYRAPARYVWFDITVFSSLPYLIAGIRLAAGRALVGAVIAEFFVSLEGVGMYVLAHARSFKHNEAVVGVLALVAFGLLFELTINWVMRRYFPWYRREGRGE